LHICTKPSMDCERVDVEIGTITFADGRTAKHDLGVGADGIGSVARGSLGIKHKGQPSYSSCLHANVSVKRAVKLGLFDFSEDAAPDLLRGPGSVNISAGGPTSWRTHSSSIYFFDSSAYKTVKRCKTPSIPR
jgi:2-polyprenyl-6-methoxyphenol hydroxylase-like FAD-dependent oxidoreductase